MCARIASALLAVLCLLTLPALADVPDPPREYYFLDQPGVLSEATEGEIFFANRLLEAQCGAQLVVAVVNRLDGVPIDQYAMTLFNRWGIGDARKNNGLLLLMDIGGQDYYALPGAGITGTFTPEVLAEILFRTLEPDFARGRYDAGARACFEELFARVAKSQGTPLNAGMGLEAYEAWKRSNQGSTPWYVYEPI